MIDVCEEIFFSLGDNKKLIGGCIVFPLSGIFNNGKPLLISSVSVYHMLYIYIYLPLAISNISKIDIFVDFHPKYFVPTSLVVLYLP